MVVDEDGFSIEPVVTISGKVVVLIVRGGPEHKKYGDPYTWSMTLVVDGTTATLKSFVGPKGTRGLGQRTLSKHLFEEYGIERVRWERRRKNTHYVSFNIAPDGRFTASPNCENSE